MTFCEHIWNLIFCHGILWLCFDSSFVIISIPWGRLILLQNNGRLATCIQTNSSGAFRLLERRMLQQHSIFRSISIEMTRHASLQKSYFVNGLFSTWFYLSGSVNSAMCLYSLCNHKETDNGIYEPRKLLASPVRLLK